MNFPCISKLKLCMYLPILIFLQRGKRISKVRVLQRAIDYITNLHDMVLDHDGLSNLQNQYYQSNLDSSLFAF